jgi:hypothetical protein
MDGKEPNRDAEIVEELRVIGVPVARAVETSGIDLVTQEVATTQCAASWTDVTRRSRTGSPVRR